MTWLALSLLTFSAVQDEGLSDVEVQSKRSGRGFTITVRAIAPGLPDGTPVFFALYSLHQRMNKNRKRMMDEYIPLKYDTRQVFSRRVLYDVQVGTPGLYAIEVWSEFQADPDDVQMPHRIRFTVGSHEDWARRIGEEYEELTRTIQRARKAILEEEGRTLYRELKRIIDELQKEAGTSILTGTAGILCDVLKPIFSDAATGTTTVPTGPPKISPGVGSSRVPPGEDPGFQPPIGTAAPSEEEVKRRREEAAYEVQLVGEFLAREAAWFVLERVQSLLELRRKKDDAAVIEPLRVWAEKSARLSRDHPHYGRVTKFEDVPLDQLIEGLIGEMRDGTLEAKRLERVIEDLESRRRGLH